jgi:hypothetical protein
VGPVRPDPPTVPKPEHLSKTASPLTNDPLCPEAFVTEGDKRLTEDAGVKRSTDTQDSYVALVYRTYDAVCVCAADKEFNRRVSPAMYTSGQELRQYKIMVAGVWSGFTWLRIGTVGGLL